NDVRRLITAAFECLDLRNHEGVHPRFGVVDVVPFVALKDKSIDRAVAMRDETARWIASGWNVPVFLYGPLPDGSTRTLPDVRRGAFTTLQPDLGPAVSHERLGACALGQRGVLVAWNIWLEGVSYSEANAIATALRRPNVRVLAFRVGDFVQISFNLIEPATIRPSQLYDQVRALLSEGEILRCELVGLAPEHLVRSESRSRWSSLDLDLDRTIEARLSH
ncbi:MAG: hypothetical protein ACYCPT_04335, partial [Acidimicrobiales bacterium]